MKKVLLAVIFVSVLNVTLYSQTVNPTVFHVWKPRAGGSILIFSKKLIQSALENTVKEYGPFRLEELSDMNRLRVL